MLMRKRACERVYPQRDRAAFGVGYGGWLSPARVADYSDSGIGLEILGDCRARFGDAIRVVGGSNGDSRPARVVRLCDERRSGRSVTRIGCRWITDLDRHGRLRMHPNQPSGNRSNPRRAMKAA